MSHHMTTHRLNRIRLARFASIGSKLALALFLWTFIWPMPHWLVVGLCLALPVVTIALSIRWGGVFPAEKSDSPSLMRSLSTMLYAPAAALAFLLIQELAGLDWWFLLFTVAVAAAVAVTGIFWLDSRVRQNRHQIGFVVLIALLFSFDTLALGNAVLDPYEGRTVSATILAMRQHDFGNYKAPNTRYYIGVDAPASPQAEKWIQVRFDQYLDLRIGQRVCVHYGPGLFGVRWYGVINCRR